MEYASVMMLANLKKMMRSPTVRKDFFYSHLFRNQSAVIFVELDLFFFRKPYLIPRPIGLNGHPPKIPFRIWDVVQLQHGDFRKCATYDKKWANYIGSSSIFFPKTTGKDSLMGPCWAATEDGCGKCQDFSIWME
eukprot:scaffold6331_cov152-Amphora_coffeaeformis.AAC.5